jgi:MFS transporter, DHA3 family, tetracycline resistance protein
VFGLATGFAVALAAYMLARLARRVTEPLYLTWLNRNIEDSSVRATVTSMVNQTGAVGEVAGGPGVGAVGTVVSLRAALVLAGAALAPAVALYARALRHGGKEPELDRLPEVQEAV